MVAALYAIPILVTLRPVADPVIDPDIWWHLRVGQWVAEHRDVPANDPFSLHGLDKPWVAYSWLFEVVVYGLYRWLGLAGVIVYRAALALAVVAAFGRLVARREPRFLVATGLTALAALSLAMLFSERPWLFTILFTTLTLDAVLRVREGQAGPLVWLLPAAYVLWANLHIQFIYGLFVLGLACAAPVLDHFLACLYPEAGWPLGEAPPWRTWPWRRAVLLLAACLLATMINPYYARLYQVVLEYATQPGPFRFVNELKALEFREPSDWVMLALAGGAAFSLGRRRPLRSFDVILLAAAAFCAFRARRDLWFLVLASLAVLTGFGSKVVAPGACFDLTLRRRAVLAAALAGLMALTAWARDLSAANLERKVADVFPARAAAVVAERGYPGPLFNDFNWGGYLIWSLPHRPVVLDGRTNLHGDERMVRIGNTWAGGPGWQDDPDLAAAGVVIAPADTPLAALLLLDRRFTLAHEDPVARVFVRRQ
jgi:hypothetical protein